MSSGSMEVNCLAEFRKVDGTQEDFLIRILGFGVAIEGVVVSWDLYLLVRHRLFFRLNTSNGVFEEFLFNRIEHNGSIFIPVNQ